MSIEICAKRSSAKLPQSPQTTLKAAISLTSPPPIFPVASATEKKITATINPHKFSKRKFIIAVIATITLIQFGISRVFISMYEPMPSRTEIAANCITEPIISP